MQLSDFDYELPDELIAQHPLAERDASRMLVVNRGEGSWRDTQFSSLPEYLNSNDVLVLNNTQVFPARLVGQRVPTGGTVELLLVRQLKPNVWEALSRPARRLRDGARVQFGGSRLRGQVLQSLDNGLRIIEFESDEPLDTVIDKLGQTPLPPYIHRKDPGESEDRLRYQTIYASRRGAIAAPTAGLHFTEEVLAEIEARGVQLAEITLHVGYGTFEPVRVNDISNHEVAPEWFSISEETASLVNSRSGKNGRVIAIGTTTTRALESAVDANGRVTATTGFAARTILPGYEFRAVDALFTNFHLPQSSLLILVSSFAGRDLTLAAYRHAVEQRYRFYSYGDCMLLV